MKPLIFVFTGTVIAAAVAVSIVLLRTSGSAPDVPMGVIEERLEDAIEVPRPGATVSASVSQCVIEYVTVTNHDCDAFPDASSARYRRGDVARLDIDRLRSRPFQENWYSIAWSVSRRVIRDDSKLVEGIDPRSRMKTIELGRRTRELERFSEAAGAYAGSPSLQISQSCGSASATVGWGQPNFRFLVPKADIEAVLKDLKAYARHCAK